MGGGEWGALYSAHTHIIFVLETFPLPDRRLRELGYDSQETVTHSESRPDKMIIQNNESWDSYFSSSSVSIFYINV